VLSAYLLLCIAALSPDPVFRIRSRFLILQRFVFYLVSSHQILWILTPVFLRMVNPITLAG
jgi:hypothetical protein